MRTRAAFAIAAALLGAAAAQAADAPRREAELTDALKGRVAGEPVDCLNLNRIRSSRIVDGTAILYTTTDGTIYVNRPDGARTLDWNDVLVTEPFGNRLCSVDIVRLYDRDLRFQTGFVGLEKFVPYRKADGQK